MESPRFLLASRVGGRWAALLDMLDQQPGVVVCTEETAARVRADRPDRDVRVDERVGRGALLVFKFESLPLHLHTKAERRRAQSG